MKVLALFALVLLGAQLSAGHSLFEIASKRKDLSTVVAAIKAAGLTKALSDSKLVATAFFPSDKAFAKFLKDYNLTLAEVVADKALLSGILAYHVVPGAAVRTTSKVLTTKFKKFTTLLPANSGLPNTISVRTSPSRNTVYIHAAFSKGRVSVPNIVAGKSIIHIVDFVLLPLNLSTPSTLPATILDSLVPAGLTALFGAVSASNQIKAAASNPATAVTVFAPTDAALQGLLGVLQVDLSTVNASTVDALLSYHILPSVVLSSQLKDGDNVVTTLLGAPITVVKNTTGVFVKGAQNYVPGVGFADAIQVVKADVAIAKSVAHVIQGVLIPPNLPVGRR